MKSSKSKSTVPVQRRYPKEEFARRGDVIYQHDVRPTLTERDRGKFVAIDIDTGQFEVDRDELEACHRLRARLPEAQIWMVRAGYRFVHRLGGRDVREKL